MRMILFMMALTPFLAGADWPQWQGPDRSAVSKETGLLKEWPKDGPPLAWKIENLGGGYSTPSVAKGRIFGMSFRGDDEVVWAISEKDGSEIWVTHIAGKPKQLDYGEGPRSSPTIDGDFLYTLGVDGELVCLRAEDGKLVWAKNLKSDFGGSRPHWGYSESPLIDGDKVIATPGGKNSIVALEKKTGQTIWKASVPKGNGAGYASTVIADIKGQRQYIQFFSGNVSGIAALDGAFLWSYSAPANGTANCSTPIYHDGYVFAASAYNTGGGLAELVKTDDRFEAKQIYFEKKMQNHHGGMVLIDGTIYGDGSGSLRCLDFKTGKNGWSERTGKGSIAAADGMLYFRSEAGTIFLVEANPKEYVEKGKFKQPQRTSKSAWSHPVIANGKLYIRDQDLLLCYDVSKK